MSFMEKLRGQLIDIIEFLDDSRDTIVWRFPRQGNEIKNGAKLIVREGQVAVFENEGQLADVFGPGTYTLETQNIPILSTLKGWKYGFNSPFKAEVYFVSTRQFTDFKWGTQNPIMMRDPEFGVVRLRGFGTYALQVTDPSALLRQLVGTDPNFRTEEIGEYFRQNVVSHLGPAIGAANIAALDIAASQHTLGATLARELTTSLAEYGVAITKFVIENISLPPEVEEALDKRTQMSVLGNLDQYTKFQTANAIEDAANNPAAPARGWAWAWGSRWVRRWPRRWAPQPPPRRRPARPPRPRLRRRCPVARPGTTPTPRARSRAPSPPRSSPARSPPRPSCGRTAWPPGRPPVTSRRCPTSSARRRRRSREPDP